MVSDAFKKSLLNIYYGEQFGEAFYATLLADATDENECAILAALLQLETEGKAKVRPLLAKYGLPLHDNPATIQSGVEMAQNMAKEDWQTKFKMMSAIIKEQGLPEYEGLIAKLSPDQDDEAAAFAAFIGEHERLILQVCENVVQSVPNPTAPLDDFLHFPLGSKTQH